MSRLDRCWEAGGVVSHLHILDPVFLPFLLSAQGQIRFGSDSLFVEVRLGGLLALPQLVCGEKQCLQLRIEVSLIFRLPKELMPVL